VRSKLWILMLFFAGFLLSRYQGTSQAQRATTATPTAEVTEAMPGMAEMQTTFSSDDLAPLVRGIYEGEDVFFIHTEASDPDVANLLTDMMGPQVIAVPNLAEIPQELLGSVYVFTNGVAGGGPMGFQPDVFDTVPGDPDYTPLRSLHRVTWQEGSTPRQLNSVAEIEAAEAVGEIVIEQPGIVINMPILVWHGEHR
jgi:hypothetical protein